MIILRVHVRRFRKLAGQVLECGPGLNVIRGRNDSGKSTLHEAFSAALFPIIVTPSTSSVLASATIWPASVGYGTPCRATMAACCAGLSASHPSCQTQSVEGPCTSVSP